MTRDERLYIQNVIELYRGFPGTTGRLGPHDRRFALLLFHQRVPIETVRVALLLGVLKRLASANASGLQPVRSLLYFKPLLDEVLSDPHALDPSYIDYLTRKLPHLAHRAAPVEPLPARPRARRRSPSRDLHQLSLPLWQP